MMPTEAYVLLATCQRSQTAWAAASWPLAAILAAWLVTPVQSGGGGVDGALMVKATRTRMTARQRMWLVANATRPALPNEGATGHTTEIYHLSFAFNTPAGLGRDYHIFSSARLLTPPCTSLSNALHQSFFLRSIANSVETLLCHPATVLPIMVV